MRGRELFYKALQMEEGGLEGPIERIVVPEQYPTASDDVPFELRDTVRIRTDVKFEQHYERIGGTPIGEGKFGKVFRCVEKSTNLELAAKFITTRKDTDREQVEREVSIMTQMRHPRIAQIYDAFYTSKDDVILIMEIVSGGELFNRVVDETYVLTEMACVMIMCQILEALDYIHSHNILHLDLKPENIMFVSNTGNRIKLIDFGLARIYHEGLKVMAGTPEFAAPEVVTFEKLSFHTDMWSVGVIAYILLSGLSPFLGDNIAETYMNVEKGEWVFEEEEFEHVSEEAKDFISNLLIMDPKKRMLPQECLAHRWIAQARQQPESALDQPASGQRIDTNKLKRYVYRRMFRKGVYSIIAINAWMKKIALVRGLAPKALPLTVILENEDAPRQQAKLDSAEEVSPPPPVIEEKSDKSEKSERVRVKKERKAAIDSAIKDKADVGAVVDDVVKEVVKKRSSAKKKDAGGEDTPKRKASKTEGGVLRKHSLRDKDAHSADIRAHLLEPEKRVRKTESSDSTKENKGGPERKSSVRKEKKEKTEKTEEKKTVSSKVTTEKLNGEEKKTETVTKTSSKTCEKPKSETSTTTTKIGGVTPIKVEVTPADSPLTCVARQREQKTQFDLKSVSRRTPSADKPVKVIPISTDKKTTTTTSSTHATTTSITNKQKTTEKSVKHEAEGRRVEQTEKKDEASRQVRVREEREMMRQKNEERPQTIHTRNTANHDTALTTVERHRREALGKGDDASVKTTRSLLKECCDKVSLSSQQKENGVVSKRGSIKTEKTSTEKAVGKCVVEKCGKESTVKDASLVLTKKDKLSVALSKDAESAADSKVHTSKMTISRSDPLATDAKPPRLRRSFKKEDADAVKQCVDSVVGGVLKKTRASSKTSSPAGSKPVSKAASRESLLSEPSSSVKDKDDEEAREQPAELVPPTISARKASLGVDRSGAVRRKASLLRDIDIERMREASEEQFKFANLREALERRVSLTLSSSDSEKKESRPIRIPGIPASTAAMNKWKDLEKRNSVK